MISLSSPGPSLCDGVTRREWLRLGGLALGGLALPHLIASPPKSGKAKSVILFGLVGGPPQHETWDPKPDAPPEVRGVFKPIATRTPGLRVGELMPRTAQLTDKIAVLRAVSTNDNAHSSSGYQMLTGFPHQPLNQESATPKAPNNAPSWGALMRAVRPEGGLPAAVTLPEHIWNDGNFPWPGQDAGMLGGRHNPWLVHCDPDDPAFKSPSLSLPDDVGPARFASRRGLGDKLGRAMDNVPHDAYGRHARKAMELLGSTAARKAFDLSGEPAKLRERYGRTRWGQSCLLARRLVEAGVGLVQVNWTRIKGKENQGGWDTHAKNNESLKSFLMPMMDLSFSALLADLEERGLLDSTLVVWFGEFGRTPRFNGAAGRDHWGHVFSLALAGGGVRGGTVHGASDKQGAYPVEGRVEGRDLIATVFALLGYPPDTEIRDAEGRPHPLSRGKPIKAVM
ncbi:MAG: DUF1501 domain-containing protein [Gemmataceae bacterium]|nr:DUF1501 domain-containing protein [Gemmataceae bacterium]